MTLFPQLIAGPIVRYRDLADQLGERHQTLARFADGIRILLIGLSKKVLLANSMGALWESLKTDPTQNGLLGAWIGAIAFTLQIYFDFSGYSDMARGLGKLFGFEIPINFDYPYISLASRNFGVAGIFRWEPGSGIMCIFLWVAAAREADVRFAIC